MKIKTVRAVFFSGTGTTEKVVTTMAKAMAEQLGAQYDQFCFNLPRDRAGELSYSSEDLVVFGVPVYAGRVPNLLLPFIQNKVKGSGTPAVPVVLYGNRNFDDGLMELRNVLHANGFMPIAAGAFVGEHSFSRLLGAGRPDEEDMGLALELARKAADRAAQLDTLPDQPVAVDGCDPIRPYYTPRDRNGEPIKDFLKAKPVTDTEICVQCGLCARVCPMGAIDLQDITHVVGKCIKCCACVKKCPTGAKHFDHKGYLYHQHELEEQYSVRRAPSKIFL